MKESSRLGSRTEFELVLCKATEKINSFIHKSVSKDIGLFSSKTRELIFLSVGSGGKRVRAVLSYIISKILGIPDRISLKIAYSIELSHAFTLVHDDIIDKPEVRRGGKPIFSEFGEELALLGGDLLLLLSFIPISFSADVVRFFAENMLEVVEGQILDVLWSKSLLDYKDKDKEEIIVEIQSKKTSHLFRIAFVLPLVVYGAINKAGYPVKRLRKVLDLLGFHFGIAFQIKDDIMDMEEDRRSHSPNILDALGKERTLELFKTQRSKVDHYINLLSKFTAISGDQNIKFFVELLKYFTDKVLSYEENIQNSSQSQRT